jgi:hypothetical protein
MQSALVQRVCNAHPNASFAHACLPTAASSHPCSIAAVPAPDAQQPACSTVTQSRLAVYKPGRCAQPGAPQTQLCLWTEVLTPSMRWLGVRRSRDFVRCLQTQTQTGTFAFESVCMSSCALAVKLRIGVVGAPAFGGSEWQSAKRAPGLQSLCSTACITGVPRTPPTPTPS